MPKDNKEKVPKPEKAAKPVKALKAPKPPKAPKKSSQQGYEAKEEESTIKGALARVGLYRRTGSSLVLYAVHDTSASPEKVWAVWSELEKWPTWDKGIVSSARWLDQRGFHSGVKFDVTYNWGFPLPHGKITETAKEIVPDQSAIWFRTTKGIPMFGTSVMNNKVCQIWFFQPLEDGGTRISRTVVFVGMRSFFAKMFKARKKYTALFKTSLESLAKLAERT